MALASSPFHASVSCHAGTITAKDIAAVAAAKSASM